MSKHVVCSVGELTPGSRRIVEVEGRSIGVINAGGTLYALRNVCPHQGAPLCEGTIGGTMVPSDPYEYVYGLNGRVLRCPWHGWEFDLETGRSLFKPERSRVKTYPVKVDDGAIVIDA
jgi:nitrite reductase/ring-hydroxylating ferredoxin subunit